MTGSDYRTTTRLTDDAGAVLAEQGETCEAVPSESLPWLIEQGVIVPASASAPDLVTNVDPGDEDLPPDERTTQPAHEIENKGI